MNVEGKEIWRTYPEFDFIQGSNFGRFRTIDREITTKGGVKRPIKGHVLKPQRMKNGYIKVRFSINGKAVNRLVHRIIASCFISNPDNLEQVNHKNCQRDCNEISNLEWCDGSYNCQYREKYGKTLSHPLFAVSLKTFEVSHFKSQIEAERETGVDNSSICLVIKGERKTAGDYWFTENENDITNDKLREIKVNMYFMDSVFAVNLKTLEVLRFESQSEAGRELKVDQSTIAKVCKSKLNQTKGFWFCHANENAVEATRAKFGDEVANKVAKLMSKK